MVEEESLCSGFGDPSLLGSVGSDAMLGSPIVNQGTAETAYQGNAAVNRHKNAAVWSYPENYEDARQKYPFAVERFFKYFYERGMVPLYLRLRCCV
jgi:hypothetical protein